MTDKTAYIAGKEISSIQRLPLHIALPLLRSALRGDPHERGDIFTLASDNVITLENIFQHRIDPTQDYARKAHIRALSNALRHMPADDRRLDPITAICLDGEWVCIDGHHRLEAHKAAGVPVISIKAFEGSVDDAFKAAAAANSKNKLPLSKRERMETAWRLTAKGDATKREIADASGVSTSQIGKMRRLKREIEETGEVALSMPYQKAMLFGKERTTDHGDDWNDKEVARIKEDLSRTFGKTLHKRRDLFAEALDSFSPTTIQFIVEQYAAEYLDDIRHLLEDESEDDHNQDDS